MIYVFDRYDKPQAILSNDLPRACPYYNDLHHEILNGENIFEFYCPSDRLESSYVQKETLVAIKDLDNVFRLFRIKIADDETVGKRKYVWAEDAAWELKGWPIRPHTFEGATAATALADVLTGCRYQPGIIRFSGSRTVVFDRHTDVISAIFKLCQVFELELRFRVEIKANRITGRYVDLLERRGADRGKVFEHGKDLQGLTRSEDSTDLATALIGLGALDPETGERLTFAGVEWSTASGDPVDKPAGQDWIGDIEAMRQWGIGEQHITGYFDDPEEDDPANLLLRTWSSLQGTRGFRYARKRPRYTYDVNLALLETTPGREHEKVRLGDTNWIKNLDVQPPILGNARVVELKRSKTNPALDRAVLGDRHSYFTEIVSGGSEMHGGGGMSGGGMAVHGNEWHTSVFETTTGATNKANAAETAAKSYTDSKVKYRHHQGTPALTWTITHGLGYHPSVNVLDSAGKLVHGQVDRINDNQLKVTFSGEMSGTAELS